MPIVLLYIATDNQGEESSFCYLRLISRGHVLNFKDKIFSSDLVIWCKHNLSYIYLETFPSGSANSLIECELAFIVTLITTVHDSKTCLHK